MERVKNDDREQDATEETIFVPEGAEKSGLMIEKNLWVPDKSKAPLQNLRPYILPPVIDHQEAEADQRQTAEVQEQIRSNYGLIKTFRKNTSVNYSTVIPDESEDGVEIIGAERPKRPAFEQFNQNRNRMATELEPKRPADIFQLKGIPKDANKSSITEEFIQMQEEELRNKFRTHSFIQNFKTFMEENQNGNVKYSAQEINIAKEQVKCKNEIIDKIIERYIDEYEIDKEKWADILKDFAKRASESIKPSGFMLDDELDINIICNEWGSYLDSAYVNGVVIKKNVIDRRLNATHEHPRILLLSNNLGYARNDSDFTDFESSIKQEDHFVEIIKEKIGRVYPNIVVVEGDVSK